MPHSPCSLITPSECRSLSRRSPHGTWTRSLTGTSLPTHERAQKTGGMMSAGRTRQSPMPCTSGAKTGTWPTCPLSELPHFTPLGCRPCPFQWWVRRGSREASSAAQCCSPIRRVRPHTWTGCSIAHAHCAQLTPISTSELCVCVCVCLRARESSCGSVLCLRFALRISDE